MEAFLHQLLAGFSTGGIYAIVALALVMIYQATQHINFSQGEMAMFSTFIAWAFINAGWPYWGAFAATVVLSFGIGAAVEFAIIRPLYKASVLAQVVTFIGLLMIFHSLAGFFFGYTIKEFPSPFAQDAWYGSAMMSAHEVGTIFIALTIVALLFAFFQLTPLGLALRAAAQVKHNYRLPDCSLVVTLEPCAMCLGAMLHARLATIAFGAPDPKTGACGGLLNLLDNPALNHQTTLVGGVMAEECGALLRQFFRERRTKCAMIAL